MSTMGNEFSGLPMAELIGAPLKAACDAQVRLAQATADFINRVGFDFDKATHKAVPRQVDFSFWQPLPLEKKYKVVGVTITEGGSGYTSPPTVSFTGGGGSGASGTAIIDAKTGKVTGVTIPSAGYGAGYVSAPAVTFTPAAGDTTGKDASGSATLMVDISTDAVTNVQKVMLSVPFLAIVNVPALMVKSVDITFDMEVKSSESHKDAMDEEASLDAAAKVGWGPFSAEVKIHGAISAHQENTRSTDRSAKYHVAVTARDDGMPEGLSRVLDILQKAIAPVGVNAAITPSDAKIAQ